LRKEFEERLKVKEEQDERAQQVRHIGTELNERMKTCETEIEKVNAELQKKHLEIGETKQLAKEKQQQHVDLKDKMKSTKQEIEQSKVG